jgi:hypothetical protein
MSRDVLWAFYVSESEDIGNLRKYFIIGLRTLLDSGAKICVIVDIILPIRVLLLPINNYRILDGEAMNM